MPYLAIAVNFLKSLTPQNIAIVILLCTTIYFYVDANVWMKHKVNTRDKEIVKLGEIIETKKVDIVTCNSKLVTASESMDGMNLSVKALQDLVNKLQTNNEYWKKKYNERCDLFGGAKNVTPKEGEVIDNEHSKIIIDFINGLAK